MATVSEEEMEQYAQWLDELERTDPQAYAQFMAMMKAQVEQAAANGGGGGSGGTSAPTGPSDAASMLEMIKSTAMGGAAAGSTGEPFKPQFPGNKVMESSGLSTKQEGVYIDVEPGFVMKTRDIKTQKKVFVNVCFSDAIQTFSQRKQLDDEGKEQEGLHVPLSLGAPHEVQDKAGQSSVAFDVAVNTQVVEDCKDDKTGSFRNFVCELAIEYIDQKYHVKLDSRYKLPKLSYRGPLPPPRHYIRKTQKPIIEEVAKSSAVVSSQGNSSTKATKVFSRQTVPATATATHQFYELVRGLKGEDRRPCDRKSAVDADGCALSEEILQGAGTHLAIEIRFQARISDADEVELLELYSEFLHVKARAHHEIAIFLPYPVIAEEAEVTLDRNKNSLEVVAPVDKSWGGIGPDQGSNPWLLAQALHDEEDGGSAVAPITPSQPEEPKSLADMFHLARPRRAPDADMDVFTSRKPTWDPVDEDEELPEDRFHRKDVMSMHILDQRKKERQDKAKQADEKRKAQRAEVEEKQRRAREAGKSWREMYPDEPETTYIDMEDIVAKEREKRQQTTPKPTATANEECVASEAARQAAAAWSTANKEQPLDIASALAFDLLE